MIKLDVLRQYSHIETSRKRDQNSEKSGKKERESSGGTENNSDGFPENL